jgi:hypothetical protein
MNWGVVTVLMVSAASAYQTFRSFHADQNQKRNKILTICCLLAVIAGSSFIEYRRSNTSAKLSEAISDFSAKQGELLKAQQQLAELENAHSDASVALLLTMAQGTEVLAPNQPFEINFHLFVKNNEAKNFASWSVLFLRDGPLTIEQNKKVWTEVWKAILKPVMSSKTNITEPKGQQLTATRGPRKLLPKDYQSIVNKTKSVYAISVVAWTNPSGSASRMVTCQVLWNTESPVTRNVFMWHECPLPSPY